MALRERRARGEVTALVVDEAQSLSLELLEEVRLLANIETPTEKLLPLVLAGQPELGDRLEMPELRQLKQRVTLRCELAPFELGETAKYIATRITTAGGAPVRLFSQEAVVQIHEHSKGIPRTINVICDNALLGAMALQRSKVDRATVVEVCRDLKLKWQSPPASATPQNVAADSAPRSGPSSLDSGMSQDVASTDVPAGEPARARRFPFRFGGAAPLLGDRPGSLRNESHRRSVAAVGGRCATAARPHSSE